MIEAALDEKLESELDALNTKISKQMAAFFQSKVKDVNVKIEASEKNVANLDGHLKAIEGTMNGELAKIKRQITDLGQGKVTS